MSDDLGFDPSGLGVQDEHAPRGQERKPAQHAASGAIGVGGLDA